MEHSMDNRPKISLDAFGEIDFEGDDDFEDRKSQLQPLSTNSPAISRKGSAVSVEPTSTVTITETKAAVEGEESGDEYFEDETGQPLSDAQVMDVKQLKDLLNYICQQMGVKLEASWHNHFASCILNGTPIFESHLRTWVAAVKQERSSGAVSDLREIVTQLSVQVSKLSGQVKALNDQVGSLTKINQQLTENSIKTAESQYAAQENMTWVIEKLKSLNSSEPKAVVPVGTVVVHDPPRKHEKEIKKIDNNQRTEEIITAFLVILQTSRDEIEDPILRLAVADLFSKEEMLAALQTGIPDDELAEVYEMIHKRVAELEPNY